jgi:putative hydrolase of the HAD superfamily
MILPKCIVFDVDDTLYLEQDYVESGFRAVGRWFQQTHGVEGFGKRCWEHFLAGTRRQTFNLVLAELGFEVTPATIKALVNAYREHDPEIELLPDSRATLVSLAPKFRLAVLTGGPPESQQRKVDALGVDRWCEPILFSGQWGEAYDKPHARAFEALERRTGNHGAECVYVSDNPIKDFVAPRALGWGVARIRREGGLHYQVEMDEAEGVPEFPDLEPLVEWLTR